MRFTEVPAIHVFHLRRQPLYLADLKAAMRSATRDNIFALTRASDRLLRQHFLAGRYLHEVGGNPVYGRASEPALGAGATG